MMKKNRVIVRHVEKRINSCLEHMEIISITGVYGSGKTTLAKKIAKERGMKFVSLDDPTTCEQACQDPQGFIASLVPTGGVIDEFQKAPPLARVLRRRVKSDPRPGRFVITGSINMFGYLPAHLPRVAMVGLAPFSQAEIEGLDSPGGFLKDALKGEVSPSNPHISLADLWPRILRGGYPGAVLAESVEESRKWLRNYESFLKDKYVSENFVVRKKEKFGAFLSYLAEVSGSWVDPVTLAKKLGIRAKTVRRWLLILRRMYIVCWLHNDCAFLPQDSELWRAKKLHFVDSGLLACLRGWHTLDPILRYENRQALLGSFVYGELIALIKGLEGGGGMSLGSYENLSGAKVEFVLSVGLKVVAVDVRASPSLQSSDFEGFRQLKKQIDEEDVRCVQQLVCGVIVYTGDEVHSTDEGFHAVPVSMLLAPSRSQDLSTVVREKIGA